MAELMKNWAATRTGAVPVHCVEETAPMGTGGAILLAADCCQGETVLATNGDSMVRTSVKSVLATHRRLGFGVTMVAVRVPDAARFGTIDLDGDRVLAFREKLGASVPGLINAGIYVFDRSRLADFPRISCSFEQDILPELVKSGIGVHVTDKPFCDIGVPDSYFSASDILGLS